jgi:hypothetical protein
VKKIQIPSSVEFIGNCCFYECKSLCEITFESRSKLQRIEEYAFYETGVKNVQIPSSVEFIGKKCFYGCNSLCEITFESRSKLQRIEESAFSVSGLKKIQIPSSVEFIDKLCFSFCSSLCEITFEGQVSVIEYGAFSRCNALTYVKFPRGVNLNYTFPKECRIEESDSSI